MAPGAAARAAHRGEVDGWSSALDSLPFLAFADTAPTSKVCVVPSCRRRLRSTYEMKCRTCPEHRKAEQVDSGPGAPPARFCQKCGRFHVLALFDGPKRSCKDSLREHNQRQRRLRRLRLNSLGRSDDDADAPAASASVGATSSGGTPDAGPTLERRFSAMKPLLDSLDINTLLQSNVLGAAADILRGDSKGVASAFERTEEAPLPPLDALEDRLEDWSAGLQGAVGVVAARRMGSMGSGLVTAPSMPLVMLPNAFDVGPI